MKQGKRSGVSGHGLEQLLAASFYVSREATDMGKFARPADLTPRPPSRSGKGVPSFTLDASGLPGLYLAAWSGIGAAMKCHSATDHCYQSKIQDIAETCDHEYYMSATGPKNCHLDRSLRGYQRIQDGTRELVTLTELDRGAIAKETHCGFALAF